MMPPPEFLELISQLESTLNMISLVILALSILIGVGGVISVSTTSNGLGRGAYLGLCVVNLIALIVLVNVLFSAMIVSQLEQFEPQLNQINSLADDEAKLAALYDLFADMAQAALTGLLAILFTSAVFIFFFHRLSSLRSVSTGNGRLFGWLSLIPIVGTIVFLILLFLPPRR